MIDPTHKPPPQFRLILAAGGGEAVGNICGILQYCVVYSVDVQYMYVLLHHALKCTGKNTKSCLATCMYV